MVLRRLLLLWGLPKYNDITVKATGSLGSDSGTYMRCTCPGYGSDTRKIGWLCFLMLPMHLLCFMEVLILVGLPKYKHNDITVSIQAVADGDVRIYMRDGWAGRSVTMRYNDWDPTYWWFPVDLAADANWEYWYWSDVKWQFGCCGFAHIQS